jgi:hypothetical protein
MILSAEVRCMGVEEYFEQPDTPQRNSPVGLLIVRLLAKNPGMNFEQARQEAHVLLSKAAGARMYRTPTVYSADEQAKRRAKMLVAFGKSKLAREAA